MSLAGPRRIARLLIAGTLLAPLAAAAQSAGSSAVPPDSSRWIFEGRAGVAEYLGRRCIMRDGGAATVKDLDLRDGIIDMDVATPAARKIAAAVRALGASRFDLKYSAGTLPHETMMRSIELYGREVMPRVRGLLAGAPAVPAGAEAQRRLERPYVMLGVNVFAAETDDVGRRLFTSLQQAFVNLRRGHPGKLPPPDGGFLERLHPADRHLLDDMLSCSVVGSAATVRRGLEEFADRTGADELMLATQIHDHQARLRSYELAAGRPAASAASTSAAAS